MNILSGMLYAYHKRIVSWVHIQSFDKLPLLYVVKNSDGLVNVPFT